MIETDMLKSFTASDMEDLRQETPLQRLGRPEDVADAFWYLASENASFLTGEILNLSGGFVV